jgi:hypothetical protein
MARNDSPDRAALLIGAIKSRDSSELATMYVWQLVSCRLRGDGWNVWHSADASRETEGPSFRVRLFRPGLCCEVTGPTLTEAYAEAARRAREYPSETTATLRGIAAPHLFRGALAARD